MFRVTAAEIEMPSAVAAEDTTDQVRGRAARVEPPASAVAAGAVAVVEVVVVVADGAGNPAGRVIGALR